LRIPEKITIAIQVGGQPTKGMFVTLKFLTTRKNPYDLLFGPSDEHGSVGITREQVLNEARRTMEFFLMDYGEIETEWTGKVQVTPMNRESIARALSAFRLFKRSYEYPPGYEESLNVADAGLADKGDADLIATIQGKLEHPITIEIVSVRAA
jgi:hypothetical protein